jgi:hypothetical protein
MSISIVSIIAEVCSLGAAVVLLFLILRAIVLGRKFVGQVYKSRAHWFAGVMLVALIWVLSGLFTVLFNLYPVSSIPVLEGLGISVFLAFVLAMFVYADRTILVALEMDFLHRNTLHWRPLRTLAYVAMFASVFYLYAFISVTKPPCGLACPTAFDPGVPSWVPAIFPSSYLVLLVPLFLVIVSLVYMLSAIIIGARRTPDMTIKRHVRWVGLGFLIFLGVFLSLGQGTTNGLLIGSFVVLAMAYTFYRALMSLTSFGRVDKVEKKIKG